MSCNLAFRFFFIEMRYGFGKEYKLTSRTRINEVYEKGAKSFVFPFKIYHLLSDSQPDLESPPFRVCIVVPKKRFKHAHDRNTIKRRTREALRLNKYLIDHKSNDKIIDIYLVYISNEIETQTKIDKAVKDVFKSFSK